MGLLKKKSHLSFRLPQSGVDMLDPYDIPSPPIPHAPNPPPVNPPPYPGLRGKKGGEKRQTLLSIWHYEKVNRETETWKVFGEHRACFVCVCSAQGGDSGVKGAGNAAKSRVMPENGWTESSLLPSDSERWTWSLVPESRKRSGMTSPSQYSFSCASLVAVVQVPQQTFETLVLFFPQGILNHCFDDIETFMGKLQQTAEAATVLNQRKKKNKKKSKKQSAEGKKRLFWQEDTYTNLFPI